MYFCNTFMSLGCMKKLLCVFMLLVVFFVACTGTQKQEEMNTNEGLPVDTQQIVQQEKCYQDQILFQEDLYM